MLSKCTKKKAGLVGCYLNVQRKNLDLLDVIYMYKKKSWTCWMLSTCAKKKAGLVVGCYLYYKGKSWNCSGIVKVLLNLIIVCN